MDSSSIFEDSLLDHYTADELLQYLKNSPWLVTTRTESRIVLLSQNLVAKRITFDLDHRDELYAIEQARSAGVRVPAVRRVVSNALGNHFLIMERVHGQTLEQLWPHIGLWKTLCVAWQLRSFLRAIHSITSQTTGGLCSGRVVSIWVQATFGPTLHAPPSVFAGYLNWWLTKCRPEYCTPYPHFILSMPREHVFVHQDLAPRNMIVDAANNLWLVDWGYAGYYPLFMEYLGMEATAMPWLYARTWTAWWGRLRWTFFRWFVLGLGCRYQYARRALAVVRQRTLRYKQEKTPFSNTTPPVWASS